MRKYIIGALIGIALTLTTSVFADDIKSLVGKAIQGEFVVKYEGVTINKKAIVIDGSSYLPVKAIADSLDLEATFNKDTGIELKKKVGVEMTSAINSPDAALLDSEIADKKKILESNIKLLPIEQEILVTMKQKQIDELDEGKKKDMQFGINLQESGVKSIIEKIPRYEQQITELESQKAALESK